MRFAIVHILHTPLTGEDFHDVGHQALFAFGSAVNHLNQVESILRLADAVTAHGRFVARCLKRIDHLSDREIPKIAGALCRTGFLAVDAGQTVEVGTGFCLGLQLIDTCFLTGRLFGGRIFVCHQQDVLGVNFVFVAFHEFKHQRVLPVFALHVGFGQLFAVSCQFIKEGFGGIHTAGSGLGHLQFVVDEQVDILVECFLFSQVFLIVLVVEICKL